MMIARETTILMALKATRESKSPYYKKDRQAHNDWMVQRDQIIEKLRSMLSGI